MGFLRLQAEEEVKNLIQSFTTYSDLLSTFTPRVLELTESIRRKEPASINETARVVDRNVNSGITTAGLYPYMFHSSIGRL